MTNPGVAGVAAAAETIFFLLLLTAAADALGTTAPLAISHATRTVCGVLAGASPRSVRCARVGDTQDFPLFPNVSFAAVSGGRDFLCGLRSGGTSFFCWNPALGARPKRVYDRRARLEEFTVGEDHICAWSNETGLAWWRGASRFPGRAVEGRFRSLTSGSGFTCAILVNSSRVRCWGSRGGPADVIEAGFADTPMSTIVAGDSHACGIDGNGSLICKGVNGSGQLNSPPRSTPFEFTKLAMGQNHSCAIRKPNNTVVCWGGIGAAIGGSYVPVNESLLWIVAGGDLTCGVLSLNFSVICWVANSSSPVPTVLPLPRILPGICTEQSSCGSGRIVPDSQTLCSGSGVICESSSTESPPPSPSPPPATPPAQSRRTSKGFLAFAIVGSVGCFAGVCSIIYCLWTGVCRQKKVHNSVQPTITGTSGTSNGAVAPGIVPSPFSSPSKTRSRSKSLIFGRQGSRVMSRQRSGPSSMKYTDRAEEFSFGELAAATKDFSPETKIGAGSFGTVYRGKLADGREVAIKRGESGPRAKKFQEKESAFQSELSFLSRLHHKHLVGLIGYCEDREERLLVYEYMKNGALYDHLHTVRGNGGGNGAAGGGGLLNSWKLRIKILLDAARGIEYLHNYAVPPIIHRDIKSSNILLDGSWTAKVSDFGLSLNGPEISGGHLALKAAGTVGYMDPEYYGLHHLTVKSDVYGLGVVVLEVLTGRRAIFRDGDGNPISVVDYAVPRIVEGEVGGVLDARVGAPGPSEAEAVELVAYTAVHCVSLEGRERPTMTDIVANLESALALCDDSHGSISSASNSIASYD